MTKTIMLFTGLCAAQLASAGTLDFGVFANAVNPVGIDYYQPGNQLLVSVHYPNGSPFNFLAFNANGTSAQYSNASNLFDEVHLAVVQPGNTGGFTTGDMYSTGTSGLAKTTSGGGTVTVPWATMPGLSGEMRGTPIFDNSGLFSNDLLIPTTGGQIYEVTSAGVASLFKLLPTYIDALLEVPNDPTYGPLAGKLLAGGDNSTKIYAVNPDGSYTTYDFGVGVEDLNLIVPNENFYVVNYLFQNIIEADASQFLGLDDSIMLTNEQGSFYRLHFDGTAVVLDPFTLDAGSPPIGDLEGAVFANLTATPEPGTFVLLAAGLCGLALKRLRPCRSV